MHTSASGVQHDSWAVASGLQSAASLASTADGAHMAMRGTSLNGTAAVHFISRAGEGLRFTCATCETVCLARWDMHVPCPHQLGKPQVSRSKSSEGDCTGSLVRVLDVPGETVTSAQWDGSGGRLALCNGVSVYLAEVKVTPMWGHISTAVIYATPPEQSNVLPACASHKIYLLGAHSMEKRAKHVPGLLMLAVSALIIVETHANYIRWPWSVVCLHQRKSMPL